MTEQDIPNDSTGDVLRRLADDGVDLRLPLLVDFHIAAPSRQICESVAQCARELGFTVHWEKDDEGPDWTVWCSQTLIPTHLSITRVESTLDVMARTRGARLDGWGASAG